MIGVAVLFEIWESEVTQVKKDASFEFPSVESFSAKFFNSGSQIEISITDFYEKLLRLAVLKGAWVVVDELL